VLSSKRALEKELGRLQARLQRPRYLSRGDHDRKTRNMKQRKDIGKYSFVNRAIQLWNPLPADAVRDLCCKPSNFRERIRKVRNEVKRTDEWW
jgi:hypothetical protein